MKVSKLEAMCNKSWHLYVMFTVHLSYKLQFFNQRMLLLFSHFYLPYIYVYFDPDDDENKGERYVR
jgi:hypothetical protein